MLVLNSSRLHAVCKFHPPIDLIPTTQYPYSNLILKRAFDLRAYGTPGSECPIYLVPGTLCRRDDAVYGGTAKCHKAFFKPDDYRSVFYPVKLSFLFLFFPPPPSILSKSLSAPPLPVSVSFFLVGGPGVLFIFFPLRLKKNHQFENVTLPLTKVQSPAARWGGSLR